MNILASDSDYRTHLQVYIHFFIIIFWHIINISASGGSHKDAKQLRKEFGQEVTRAKSQLGVEEDYGRRGDKSAYPISLLYLHQLLILQQFATITPSASMLY